MCMDVRGRCLVSLYQFSPHLFPVNLGHVADSPSLLGKQVPGSQVLLLTTYADAWLFLCKLQGLTQILMLAGQGLYSTRLCPVQ